MPLDMPESVLVRFKGEMQPGVTLRDATIGPNVTVESGSMIEGSTVAHAILGRDVRVRHAQVQRAVIGDAQVIENRSVSDSVMDGGELAPAK